LITDSLFLLLSQKIARAYEVLTDNQKRAEYDFMRYNQEAYFQKYGANVLWQYAPKSDATFIVIFLLILVNWFTWIAQKQRWQNVADRLIKATVEEWSPSMGGSSQSKHLRDEALEILAKETKQEEDSNGSISNNTGKSSKTKAKKGEKVSGKEKKRLEQEALKPIVAVLVGNMHDFGAGFHKPTWRDLFLVKVSKFPYHLLTGAWWQTKYLIRRVQKKELNEAERLVLTERAVGHVTWDLATEEDHQAMVKRELWIMDNLAAWKEEQAVKNWSKADQKQYAKMKKKGIKEQ
jgi:DnaJ family protein C protein 25